MKFDGCGQESCGHALVESQGQLDELGAAPLDCGGEPIPAQMLTEDAAVDGVQSVHSREGQCKHGEMPLRGRNGQFQVNRDRDNSESVRTQRAGCVCLPSSLPGTAVLGSDTR